VKRPQIKSPDIKVPEVVENLYRDLRDRNLLPVAALLVVAIIAVPIVLSMSSDSTPAQAPSAEIVPADAPEAQAAVLAENPGLRNYKQRLEDLKATDPFTQQFQSSGLSGTTVESTSGDTGTVTSSDETPTSSGSLDVGSSSSSSVSSGSTASTEPTTTVDAGGAGDTGDPTVEQTKPKFYTWKLDVHYGIVGDVQKRDNVKVLDLLSPVGVFMGASFDAEKAYFFLSSDVASVSGDGECLPAPTDCQFLTLEEGKSSDLVYQTTDIPTPTTYTLALDDINVVKAKKPPEPK
jgi:hypothetical protein